MSRREFITFLGGAAAWPLAAQAQQPVPGIPRLIYFPNAFPDDLEQQARRKAFRDALEKLGWADGRKIWIEEHWGTIPVARMRSVATEFVRSAPAVIVTAGTPPSEALKLVLKLEGRTIPVVFVGTGDPVESGLIDSMAHPGGNLTGFINYENSVGGKWLGLLKEAAPDVGRVLVILAPGNIGHEGFLRAMEMAAPTLGVQVIPVAAESRLEIERAIETFATQPNGGLVAIPGPPSLTEDNLIVTLAARHRLPAMYAYRGSTLAGGLMSYGTDIPDLWRRAAGYVDRILKGEKPGDLPVQLPTKYDLVINLKTAKTLGITVPLTLRGRADEVIE